MAKRFVFNPLTGKFDIIDAFAGTAAGGDLSGTYPNPSVVDDSHNHTAATITGVIETGDAAGGDLGGTYPNPSVNDDSHAHTAATLPGFPVGANPTGTIGLTAVNGVATTFVRSDGAPPLSQAIVPTWTGAHIWNLNSATAVKIEQTGVKNNVLVVDTTNARVGVNIAPLAAVHTAGSGAGTTEIRISNSGTGYAKIGLWQTTDDPPTDGGFVSYNGAAATPANVICIGVRDGGTTDRAVIQVSKSNRWCAIGVEATGSAANAVAIGRLSSADQSTSVVIGSSLSATLTAAAANTLNFGIAGVRLLVITSTGAGFGTDSPATKLHAVTTDATTNAVVNVFTLGKNVTGAGVGANGLGAGQLFTLETSTTVDTSAARLRVKWDDATHATRKASMILSAYDTAERDGLGIAADGSAAQLTAYGDFTMDSTARLMAVVYNDEVVCFDDNIVFI